MKTLISLYVLFTFLACGQGKDNPITWKSKFRDLQFNFQHPWTLVPVLDSAAHTFVGVIDMKDGKSYIIQFFDDVSKERLSDESYMNGIKQTMLQPNPKNKLITEDSVLFHEQKSHRQTYLMFTEKWGLLKQFNYVIRTGKELITVQMLYPTNEQDAVNDPIPLQLVAFDKQVKLNGR